MERNKKGPYVLHFIPALCFNVFLIYFYNYKESQSLASPAYAATAFSANILEFMFNLLPALVRLGAEKILRLVHLQEGGHRFTKERDFVPWRMSVGKDGDRVILGKSALLPNFLTQ